MALFEKENVGCVDLEESTCWPNVLRAEPLYWGAGEDVSTAMSSLACGSQLLQVLLGC